MPSAEPGSRSLGLVLLAHTTRCIIAIFIHLFGLFRINLRLIPQWFRFLLIAVKLVGRAVVESAGIVSVSTKKTVAAWKGTFAILLWAVPYTVFLFFFILQAALFVVILEECETVYLGLRSSRFGTAVLGFLLNEELLPPSPLDRPSPNPWDPSIAATDRILSVPERSLLFRALSTPSLFTASQAKKPCSRILTFLKGLSAYLSTTMNTATTQTPPERTRMMTPEQMAIQSLHNLQGPLQPTRADQSYRAEPATNYISMFKDAVLHSISAVMGTVANCSTAACAPSSADTAGTSNTADAAGYSTCKPEEFHASAHGGDTVPNALHSAARSPVLVDYEHSAPCSERQSQHHPQPSGRRDADKKRLPKSRTLTVLSNLTASLSRSSLASFAGSERKTSQHTVSSRKTSSSSTFASNAPTRTATPTSPEVNPLIITTAQPSAYWSGRFLSLQDRFQGESLQEKTLSIFVAAHASKSTILAQQREVYQRRGNLPLSTTTALDRYGTNAAVQEAERLSDEDNRCLRIFLHLDALCGTPEAQKSLHAWQEAYARRAGRDVLLPQGASVEKGFVARLFSGSSRRSLGSSRSGKETTKGKQLLTAF
ncbi:hypothetical protein CH35J_000916 [Colletotrichum higginsianum]|uniref:Uncharacterized protein n=1 Tax=Colletotrichum higginsianum TaxID=80884 RepID=A0A4T0WHT8_9PEZI|nr:hypothetical protein CH35J_000916 [Colletotrichum higginsianum]